MNIDLAALAATARRHSMKRVPPPEGKRRKEHLELLDEHTVECSCGRRLALEDVDIERARALGAGCGSLLCSASAVPSDGLSDVAIICGQVAWVWARYGAIAALRYGTPREMQRMLIRAHEREPEGTLPYFSRLDRARGWHYENLVWGAPESAFKNWRIGVQVAGVRVSLDQFCDMFCCVPEEVWARRLQGKPDDQWVLEMALGTTGGEA